MTTQLDALCFHIALNNPRVVLTEVPACNREAPDMIRCYECQWRAVPIGIAYTADINRARELLLEIAKEHSQEIETVGCPVIQLGASSVTLSVRAWCTDVLAARNSEWKVYEQAKVQFEQAGIEIPYPYQNVIVKKDANRQTVS